MGKSVLHAVARTAGKSSERKRLVKLCVRKLQSIEDPETLLCRSVLINNTLKNLQTLQREARLRRERESLRRLAEAREEDEDEEDFIEDEVEKSKLSEEDNNTPVIYSAEDILSDIEMPPPLSPNLEDLSPIQVIDLETLKRTLS